jgi:Cu/Ag efflux pump CusA
MTSRPHWLLLVLLTMAWLGCLGGCGKKPPRPNQGDAEETELGPGITMVTEAPGLAPEEIEVQVTLPLESLLAGAEGVRRICSASGSGRSIIWLELDRDTDLDKARALIAARLQRAGEHLPGAAPPALAPVVSSGDEVLLAVRSGGGTRSPEELRALAELTLRPRLVTIPGVAQVVVMGGARMQCQILAAPDRLAAYDLTLLHLADVVENAAGRGSDGKDKRSSPEPRLLGPTLTAEDLSSLPVLRREPQPVLLRDVAEVRIGGPRQRVECSVWEREEAPTRGGAVFLGVRPLPKHDPKVLEREVANVLGQLQQDLPVGVQVEHRVVTPQNPLAVHVWTAAGTGWEAARRTAQQVEKQLAEIPAVLAVWRRTGRADPDEPAGRDQDSLLLAWLRGDGGRPREQVHTDVRDRLAHLSAVAVSLGPATAYRLDRTLAGTRGQMVVKVFGPDLEELWKAAADIRTRMDQVPGVVDLQIEPQVGVPHLQLKVNRQAAARLGVAAADVVRAFETAHVGRKVAAIADEARTLDVVLQLGEKERDDPAEIRKTLLDTAAGRKLTLDQVAELRAATGPTLVYREDRQRRVAVFGNVHGRDRTQVAAEVRKALAPVEQALRQVPGNYGLEVGGPAAARR